MIDGVRTNEGDELSSKLYSDVAECGAGDHVLSILPHKAESGVVIYEWLRVDLAVSDIISDKKEWSTRKETLVDVRGYSCAKRRELHWVSGIKRK
jgi:hypothetical protein